MKYRVHPSYRPFAQLPYCCVPATLQWILYRHGLDILDQESIGAELGLRLPLKGKKFFKKSGITFVSSEPKTGFGTRIEQTRFSIGQFFERKKIPLEISRLILVNTKRELKKIIRDSLAANRDVILRYNNRICKQSGERSYGHFSVIVAFDEHSGRITIGDPELPYYKIVTLDQILFSISPKIDGIQRGLYVVQPRLIPRSRKNRHTRH